MSRAFVTLLLVCVLWALAADRRVYAAGAEVSGRQAEVERRMSELEQRLLELTTAPDAAGEERTAEIARALRLSRERFIVERMERIRTLLASNRYAEAADLQREVLADIDAVAAVLAATPGGEDVERLREVSRELESMLERQSALSEALRTLTDRGALPRMAEGQGELRDAAEGLLSEMASRAGSAELASAAAAMGQAAQAMAAADVGSATEAQRRAEEDLQAALEQVRRAIEAMDRRLMAERRAKLRAMLEEVLARQRAVTEQTRSLVDSGYDAQDPRRAQLLKLAELAARERALQERVGEAADAVADDGTTALLPSVLGQAVADLARCADLLGEGTADAALVRTQRGVEDALQDVLDALSLTRQEEMQPEEETEEQQQKRKKPERLVSVTAELKLLRAMQMRLNDATRRTDAEDAAEISRLAARQARMAGMVEEMAAAMSDSQRE